MKFVRDIARALNFHPRAVADRWLSYPRYLGTIKPALLGASAAEFDARMNALASAWWPTKIECPVGRRILAVSPHPDDESIGAGGFMLAHRNLAEQYILTVFNGEGGGALEGADWRDDPEYKRALVERRRAELGEVADRLGVKRVYEMGLADGQVSPSEKTACEMREIVAEVNPDVVLIPWFLDSLHDHKVTNILWAWGCSDIPCVVFAYEVWTLLRPNAYLDISGFMQEKLDLIRVYQTQTRTVDYVSYMEGLSRVRAFHHPVNSERNGAVEGFWAIANTEYCDLVRGFYGDPGALKTDALGA